MKKILFFLLLPLAAFSQNGKEFKVKGSLKTTQPADWVYLRYMSGDKPVMDSLQPDKDEYKFEGEITEPGVATLIVKYKLQAGEEKARREMYNIFLEPTKIELSTKDSLENTVVTGSSAQADYLKLSEGTKMYESMFTPLYKAYEEANKKNDKAETDRIRAEIEAADAEMKEKVYASFIRKNSSSPVALYALKQYAGWDLDPAKVEPLFTALPAKTKESPGGESFKKQIDIAKKTAVGTTAMDFTQADTLGVPVSLSSFKGKYVLVDFWASWCGPCRKENPNVVKAFNTYKDRNFTVLGVSLDRPDAKDKWLAAIHKDGLTWTQLSDLKYWDNAVAKQYGIRAIPQNFLLDPNGKIVAKNIRGEDLLKKLEEILPK